MQGGERLEEVGNGAFAYLQPDGSWGLNNAGLIVDGEASLLVDTLFDLPRTRRMLEAMAAATEAAERVETVVNTHANGDHCWGNQLVASAEIIASRASAREMEELSPKLVSLLTRLARLTVRGGKPARAITNALGRLGLEKIGAVGEAADFVVDAFGRFDFRGIELTPPDRTFEERLALRVGDKEVELIEVGPAHTKGDVLVWSKSDRLLFAGDILFIGGHPIVWEGPVDNWIRACERIEALDPEVIVPGHGPITDLEGVAGVRAYLEHLKAETTRLFEDGASVEEATRQIAFPDFASWGEWERVAVNVDTIYRGLEGGRPAPDPVTLMARMARLRRERRGVAHPG